MNKLIYRHMDKLLKKIIIKVNICLSGYKGILLVVLFINWFRINPMLLAFRLTAGNVGSLIRKYFRKLRKLWIALWQRKIKKKYWQNWKNLIISHFPDHPSFFNNHILLQYLFIFIKGNKYSFNKSYLSSFFIVKIK